MQLSLTQLVTFLLLDFVLGGLLGWAIAALTGRRSNVQVASEERPSGERVARILDEVSVLVGQHGDSMKRFDAVRMDLESHPEHAVDHVVAAHAEASECWAQLLESRTRELNEVIADDWSSITPTSVALAKYQTLAADYAGHLGESGAENISCPVVGELIANLLVANEQLAARLEEARSALVDTDEQLRVAQRSARIDALTGLPNRRAFDEQFETLLAKLTREPSRPFSLTLIDVDHFKKLNDEHGHATGDAMLKIIGNVLREQCRGCDHLSRWGGEEFAILSENTNERSASIMANRLRTKIAGSRLTQEGVTVSCTVSAGVAQMRADIVPTQLLEQADAALYEAKNAGRNTVRVAPETTPVEADAELQPA